MKTEKYNSDITKDDLTALRKKTENLRSDNSDDRYLKERKNDIDFAATDLDIPGRNLNSIEKNNSKDEENQHYSLGSEDNENLEIDTKN